PACPRVDSLLVIPRPPPRPPPFPYPPLFRSRAHESRRRARRAPGVSRSDARPPGSRGRAGRPFLLAVQRDGAILARSADDRWRRSEEHTSELQSRENLVCRLLLEKKNTTAPR